MRIIMSTLLTVTLMFNLPLFSREVTKVGTTAADLLNIDVGARATGMGGAFVAVASDVTSMYWNPAGIARFSGTQAVFSNMDWIADLAFNYAGVVLPFGNLGTIGLNATFLTMGEMEVTTIGQPEGTGEKFDAGSYTFGFCYARTLTDRFSIGFNAKYVREQIYHSHAQGLALDVGTLFTTDFHGLQIGMNISNFGTKMQMTGRDMLIQKDIDETVSGNNETINGNLGTDQFDMPLMFRIGISVDILKGAGNSNLIMALDALHPNDDEESMRLGGEYILRNMFSLRAGYQSLFVKEAEKGLSLGAGLRYPLMGQAEIVIDFAYVDFGVFNNVQQFTLSMRF